MRSNFLHKTTCLMLSFCLMTSFFTTPPAISAAGSTDSSGAEAFANCNTISRVFSPDGDNHLQYYYVDDNNKRVDLTASQRENISTGSSFKRAVSVPESFDLRKENAVTSIKNQGVTGCCWAFSALKSLESNLITKGLATSDSIDLSESHLAWYALHTSSQKTDSLYGEGISMTDSDNRNAYLLGGSALIGAFTLARWSGAVNESLAPFQGNSASSLNKMANTMTAKPASFRYKKNYLLTDATCYDNASQDEIKYAIMTNGAMDASFYYNPSYACTSASREISYYQSYYTDSSATDMANHSITIIGWDDSYSKENFSGTYQPASDGAWLIANSYGSSYGKDGYFWMSYEEPSLSEFYEFSGTTTDTFHNNYQYDAIGWGRGITSSVSSSVTGANIFTANENYTQSLKAVGIYTLTDNQSYTVKIYRNVTASKPTSGTLAATITGTEPYAGYHTVYLPSAVSLNANEKFSVVITYKRTNGKNGYLPIEGPSNTQDSITVDYTSHAGESFLYLDTSSENSSSGSKKWYDLNLTGTDTIKNNICVKAFTTNEASSGTISLPKNKVTLGKKETYKPAIKVKNVADKTLTFTSSNKKVASVSSSGKITAKKTGKAVIKAKLSTGRTANLQVTVKKAPSKITTRPARRKTIARRKKFQIKVKLPAGSASNQITYTSSKPKVAKVNAKGKVTAKKKGTAIITVKTFNKKKAKIKVQVK